MSKIVRIVLGAVALASIPFGGFTVFGLVFGLKAAAFVGATLVFSGVSGYLKPKASSLLTNVQGRTITVRQPAAPRRIILGQALVGGVITFAARSGANNEYFHMVLTLSGHECQEIGTMYFDGVEVPLDGSGDATGTYAGRVHVEKNLGTSTQSAFAGLVAAAVGWESTDRQLGCAGAYIRLLLDSAQQMQDGNQLFPSVPPNITFLVKGAKFYDPRSALTAWTNNAALVAAGYICNPDFGLGASYARRIDEAELIASANTCEESVSLNTSPATYENRYTINGVFESSETPGRILEQMAVAMGAGDIFYSGGRWRVLPGVYRAPEVTLSEQHFVAPLKVTTLRSKRDLCNAIKGTFVSPVHGWTLTDFPAVISTAYAAIDGETIFKDISLPFTVTATMAQRIAKIILGTNRRQVSFSSRCSMSAYALQPGDTAAVSFTRYGWSAKVFKALACPLVLAGSEDNPALAVEPSFAEHTADIFTWDPAEGGTLTTLPDVNLRHARGFVVRPPGGYTFSNRGQGTAAYAQLRDNRDDGAFLHAEEVNGTVVSIPVALTVPYQAASDLMHPVIGIATVLPTGGTLPGGITLYYGVAAGAGGLFSPPEIIEVVIPAGTDTNKVTLGGLEFDAAATAMRIYRGWNRQSLAMIVSSTAPDVTFEDTGGNTVSGAGSLPADPALALVQGQWRRVMEAPYGPTGADIQSADTIGYSGAGWTTDQWAGHAVEIVRGTGMGQIRSAISNTADTLAVHGGSPVTGTAWDTTPDATSVFVIYRRATSATASTVSDSGAAWTSSEWIGYRVRIVYGPLKMLHQERIITANTATQLTVDQDWDVTPDDTCGFEIVGPWVLGGSVNAVPSLNPYVVVTVEVPNEPGLLIEIAAIALDRLGRPSDPDGIAPSRYVVVGADTGTTGTLIIAHE